jgi:hypothetical protein
MVQNMHDASKQCQRMGVAAPSFKVGGSPRGMGVIRYIYHCNAIKLQHALLWPFFAHASPHADLAS